MLDHEMKPTRSGRYSKLSFGFGILSMALMVYVVLNMTIYPPKHFHLIRGIFICTLIGGPIATTLSYIRREKNSLVKIIGLVLNAIIVILFLVVLVFNIVQFGNR